MIFILSLICLFSWVGIIIRFIVFEILIVVRCFIILCIIKKERKMLLFKLYYVIFVRYRLILEMF